MSLVAVVNGTAEYRRFTNHCPLVKSLQSNTFRMSGSGRNMLSPNYDCRERTKDWEMKRSSFMDLVRHRQRKSTNQYGVDFRFSKPDTLWGAGIYFAEAAKYSDQYAHNTQQTLKQILLAKVLTGESYYCMPPDSSMKLPPLKITTSQVFTDDRYRRFQLRSKKNVFRTECIDSVRNVLIPYGMY